MAFHRRFPLYARPLPFLAGWVLLILGIGYGFSWVWDTSVFSGSLLIQTKIPTTLIVFKGIKILWLIGAAVGAALLAFFAYGSRRAAARGGPWAPKWRFFPLTALLGLFLVFFGGYWLFDLRFSFDEVGGVFVMFTSLNYANVLSRPFIGTVGALVMGVGLVAVLGGGIDLRIPRAKPEKTDDRPTAPEPSPSQPIERQPAAAQQERPQWLEDAPPASEPKPAVRPKPTATAKPAAAGSKKKAAPKKKPAAKNKAPAAKGKQPAAAAKGRSTGA